MAQPLAFCYLSKIQNYSIIKETLLILRNEFLSNSPVSTLSLLFTKLRQNQTQWNAKQDFFAFVKWYTHSLSFPSTTQRLVITEGCWSRVKRTWQPNLNTFQNQTHQTKNAQFGGLKSGDGGGDKKLEGYRKQL